VPNQVSVEQMRRDSESWQRLWRVSEKAYVTAEMTDLLLAAAGDMPDEPFVLEDLPWVDGFVVFPRVFPFPLNHDPPTILGWQSGSGEDDTGWAQVWMGTYLGKPGEAEAYWAWGAMVCEEGDVFAGDVEDEESRQAWCIVPAFWRLVQQQVAAPMPLERPGKPALKRWKRANLRLASRATSPRSRCVASTTALTRTKGCPSTGRIAGWSKATGATNGCRAWPRIARPGSWRT
jgi:hypothetical protein